LSTLRQCFSTYGHTSIRFYLLREKHTRLHLNGSVEWVEEGSHPVADALRGL
jgi:hypothetical protein